MVKVYKAREVVYFIEDNISTDKIEKKQESIEINSKEILNKVREEALKVLTQAKNDASIMLKDAEKKASEMQETAKKEGFLAGVSEGKKACENEIAHAKEQAQKIINDAKTEKIQIIESLQHEILNMSFVIAEKIIGTELDKNHDSFQSLIQNAINNAEDVSDAQVCVSEEDYSLHYEALAKDKRVKCDSSLNKGEIKVYTVKGTIDASIEKQLLKAKSLVGVGA